MSSSKLDTANEDRKGTTTLLTKSEASLSVDKYTYKADPLVAFKFFNLRRVLPSSRSRTLANPSTLREN